MTTRTISAEVWALERRLEAAEAVCWMYGFSPAIMTDAHDREKATALLWRRWHESQTKADQKAAVKAWPDDLIKQLADQYDAHRSYMRERIEGIVEVVPS